MKAKPFYKSKTVWFNLLTAIIVVAGYFGFDVDKGLASESVAALLAVNPLVNLILRGWTKSAITLK